MLTAKWLCPSVVNLYLKNNKQTSLFPRGSTLRGPPVSCDPCTLHQSVSLFHHLCSLLWCFHCAIYQHFKIVTLDNPVLHLRFITPYSTHFTSSPLSNSLKINLQVSLNWNICFFPSWSEMFAVHKSFEWLKWNVSKDTSIFFHISFTFLKWHKYRFCSHWVLC